MDLREVWLYTNTDCNLACRHCLLPDHGLRPPYEQLARRLDEALEMGARRVFLTGGEPFIREDLGELVASAAERANVVILTNGTLVTRRRLAALDRAGVGARKGNVAVQVSIEGGPAGHDALRGRGTFDSAVRGIRALTEWGVTPILATALTRLNLSEVPQVTQLAGGLGLRAHHLMLPHATGRLAREPDLLPSAAEILQAVRRCRRVAGRVGVVLDNDESLAVRARQAGARYVGCNGGHQMLAVGADGGVYPCPSMVGVSEAGCRGAATLGEAYASAALESFREHSVDRRRGCRRCPVRYICGGGCTAYAFWNGGDVHSDEPYCDVYRGIIEDHEPMPVAPAGEGDLRRSSCQ